MRDDRAKWAAPLEWDGAIDLGDVTLTPVTLDRQVLISGTDVRRQMDVPLVAWPDIALGPSYALSLRRDRVLVVNGPEMVAGWDGARAVSDASDAYAVLDLLGPGAFGVLQRGTEIRSDQPSASVMRRLFGFEVMVYRFGAEDRFRLHVGRAYRDGLVDACRAAVEGVAL